MILIVNQLVSKLFIYGRVGLRSPTAVTMTFIQLVRKKGHFCMMAPGTQMILIVNQLVSKLFIYGRVGLRSPTAVTMTLVQKKGNKNIVTCLQFIEKKIVGERP